MNYLEKLRQSESILCIGLDPVLEKIPEKGSTEERIVSFFTRILDAIEGEDASIGAVKPNIAFYEQYGFEGLRALKRVIELAKHNHIVILDAKRADIGKTSAAYAKAIFDFWAADATTVSPYMGYDSVAPFIDYCKKGKGVYILTKTSNPGAEDFQDLPEKGTPLYKEVAKKINGWYTPGIGAVVGATYPAQLKEIVATFKKPVPLLLPGIGTQGASIQDLPNEVKNRIHRISAGSSIIYAYQEQRYQNSEYVEACLKEIKDLNNQIGRVEGV